MDKLKEIKIKENLNKLLVTSFVKNSLKKKSGMQDKEIEKHKITSLKYSVFLSLFVWLGAGVLTKNVLLSAGIALIIGAIIFILLVQAPLTKRKTHALKVEADLPIFLTRFASEIKVGKNIYRAIGDSCKEGGAASGEFEIVLQDMQKGASFGEALILMNERLSSPNVRRACSNLSNLNLHGAKDVSGLKRLAQELLLKQRIESKEFSGKMVVFALVFIAVSAIVPAMFQSFVLIGSYFMKLSFTAGEVFIISVFVFPLVDLAILLMIDKKTPVFLKE